MNTAVLYQEKESSEMFYIKYLSYILKPKIFLAALLLDITGILHFITKYVYGDVSYLKFLIVACVIDLVTGVTKVWKNDGVKAVTSKGFRDTVSKAISYGSFVIIVHVVTHFTINGDAGASNSFVWLNKLAYQFLIMIEVKSVYENIIQINPKLDFIDSSLQKVIEIFKSRKNDK